MGWASLVFTEISSELVGVSDKKIILIAREEASGFLLLSGCSPVYTAVLIVLLK